MYGIHTLHTDDHEIQVSVVQMSFSQKLPIIHIVHGMMEDVLEYNDMANYLAEKGFKVILQELPGHGCQSKSVPGILEQQDYTHAIEDIYHIHQEFHISNQPYFLLGFSMGSFMVRHAIAIYPEIKTGLSGVLLAGTGWNSNLSYRLTHWIANKYVKHYGPDNIHHNMDKLLFYPYNCHFRNTKDKHTWLFADPYKRKSFEEKYKRFVITPRLLECLTNDMYFCSSKAVMQTLQDIPILLLYGKYDQICKNPYKIVDKLTKAGIKTDLYVFDKRRHCILTDTHAKTVWKQITEWCNSYITQQEEAMLLQSIQN